MEKKKQKAVSSILLKVFSLFFGILFWYLFMQNQVGFYQISVPICFYNIKKNMRIHAPETVDVIIRGKHIDYKNIKPYNTAIQINAEMLHKEKNIVDLNEHYLMIPEQFTLKKYISSSIIVFVQRNESIKRESAYTEDKESIA